MDRRQSPSRAGFTLIEVLIAVLIVATLVALLLPAVRGAFRKAQESQVGAELNNLATALASFKNAYGDFPPSRLLLCETGYTAYRNSLTATQLAAPAGPLSPSGNGADISVDQLIQRSRLYMRRFWPRVDFDNAYNGLGTVGYDFNNDGTISGTWTLSGSECLAFFLGGIPSKDSNGGFGMTGFSKLPTNSFISPIASIAAAESNNNLAAVAASNNRTVPNYEFNAGRLKDLDNDGFPSYLDPIDASPDNQRSYAYFCSYGTNSYDPNDVNGLGKHFDYASTGNANDTGDYEHEDPYDPNTPYIERGFSVTFPTTSANPNFSVSPGPNPYCTTTLPAPSAANLATTSVTVSWINPNSFQLFSAGQDRLWGLGGTYAQGTLSSTGRLPIAADGGIVTAADTSNGVRQREADNLTNFSGGRLD